MSQQPISRSPDLSRLRTEGYDIVVSHGHLLVRDVPYLDSSGQIVRGVLAKALTLNADVADRPGDHTAYLAGPQPFDIARQGLDVVNSSGSFNLTPELIAQFRLSRKPQGGYADFYELMTSYCQLLSKHAQAVAPTVTAQTNPVIRPDEDDPSPFVYIDTASARAGITTINAKLLSDRLAIVGLGGTGAYLLDLIAKTWARQIDLFDGDRLMQHNCFRYPGAVPIEVVDAKPFKVDYLAGQYSAVRHGVVAHPYYVNETNVHEVLEADFVFLAVDDNPTREMLARRGSGRQILHRRRHGPLRQRRGDRRSAPGDQQLPQPPESPLGRPPPPSHRRQP